MNDAPAKEISTWRASLNSTTLVQTSLVLTICAMLRHGSVTLSGVGVAWLSLDMADHDDVAKHRFATGSQRGGMSGDERGARVRDTQHRTSIT